MAGGAEKNLVDTVRPQTWENTRKPKIRQQHFAQHKSICRRWRGRADRVEGEVRVGARRPAKAVQWARDYLCQHKAGRATGRQWARALAACTQEIKQSVGGRGRSGTSCCCSSSGHLSKSTCSSLNFCLYQLPLLAPTFCLFLLRACLLLSTSFCPLPVF